MGSSRPQQSVNAWNPEYLESLYRQWAADPDSVDEQVRQFFQGFELGLQQGTRTKPAAPGDAAESGGSAVADIVSQAQHKQRQVDQLIYHYRDIGHLAAELDPLGTERPFPRALTLEAFSLTDADLEMSFDPGSLPLANPATLRDIIQLLEDTYCRHVGMEYMHIQDTDKRRWLQKRMETVRNQPKLAHGQKMAILRELIEADGFESFCHTRYIGTKRFGIDGGESLIPMLDQLIELGPANGIKEFTIGMAHRGRLNVLVNILRKSYDQIFTEFEEAWVEDFLAGGGDVKYHRGFSSDHLTSAGHEIRLTLSPNPSHLEHVNPVVLGRCRAKQRIRKDAQREQCVPILIHGDASFPAQGVVAECFNMMKLDGYTVGGTVHIVINNQIGFTTEQKDASSGVYCTDIAKFVEAPVFHVNGDDPEACAFVARLALEFRQAFKHDAVVDLWCYRKYGHNETDEPTFTQPLMYQRIRAQKPVLKRYVEKLIAEGEITQQQFDDLYARLRAQLDEAQNRSREQPVEPSVRAFNNVWAGLTQQYSDDPVETGVSRESLEQVSRALGTLPKEFTPHKNIERLLKYRRGAVTGNEPLDWAMGEMLAYGTLLLEGHAVRLTGQDVERGTFSHRHAVIFDQRDGQPYDALNHIDQIQARFCIHNSPLTESACIGFEYGYSLGDPKMLVLWEAQFGDFVNGAQVMIDQFIASAETKWKRFSGLTLLLPHGFEGAGPEHSSARLERFLTLCADNNMQVVYPTTPAQMFHVLRRQMKRGFRKPLVIMTPKSLLRLPAATSAADELVNGRFHRVIDDAAVRDPARVKRLILCTGKIFYDLSSHREKARRDDVAIVRLEQLYPFPADSLRSIFDKYAAAHDIHWVQEEPKNMGAWRHVQAMLDETLDIRDVEYLGREPRASPAVASYKMHQQEQEKILISALGLAEHDQGAASPKAGDASGISKQGKSRAKVAAGQATE